MQLPFDEFRATGLRDPLDECQDRVPGRARRPRRQDVAVAAGLHTGFATGAENAQQEQGTGAPEALRPGHRITVIAVSRHAAVAFGRRSVTCVPSPSRLRMSRVAP